MPLRKGGVEIKGSGSMTMSGGKIYGTTGYGIYVGTESELTLDGGEVYDADIGVVSLGTVQFKSGQIHDMTKGDARAFHLAGSGSLTMSGGEISKTSGYAVTLFGNSTMAMQGGSIKDCTGGGVLIYQSGASLDMTGGTISGCGNIGGIYYMNGKLTVGGSAVVNGNKPNVYMAGANKIAVSAEAPLREDARIGVFVSANASFAPKEGVLFTVTDGLDGHGSEQNFINNSSVFASVLYEGEFVLASKSDLCTVSFDSDGGDAVASQTILKQSGKAAAKPEDPKKAHYTFQGWKMDGADYDFSTMVTQDVALKAAWQEDAHAFAYSTNGNVLTAECSKEGCPLPDGRASLTLAAPEKQTYGDSGSAEAVVSGDVKVLGKPDIVYKKDGNVLEHAPMDAGAYTASISAGEGDSRAAASIEYTIAQKDIENAQVAVDGAYQYRPGTAQVPDAADVVVVLDGKELVYDVDYTLFGRK